MTYEEYLQKKEQQKGIWLAKVLAHGTDNEEQVIKEALTIFEETYPKYEKLRRN